MIKSLKEIFYRSSRVPGTVYSINTLISVVKYTVPGVTAAFAAAAAAKVSFTLPEKVQTLIFSRMEGRTPVPDRERLRDLAGHGAALAIYLSAANPERLVEELLAGGYPGDTPVVLAYRVGWPDEWVVATQISDLSKAVKDAHIKQQAIFLVLPGQKDDPVFSKLYSSEFSHGCRSVS